MGQAAKRGLHRLVHATSCLFLGTLLPRANAAACLQVAKADFASSSRRVREGQRIAELGVKIDVLHTGRRWGRERSEPPTFRRGFCSDVSARHERRCRPFPRRTSRQVSGPFRTTADSPRSGTHTGAAGTQLKLYNRSRRAPDGAAAIALPRANQWETRMSLMNVKATRYTRKQMGDAGEMLVPRGSSNRHFCDDHHIHGAALSV
jgi:hypothetical protein